MSEVALEDSGHAQESLEVTKEAFAEPGEESRQAEDKRRARLELVINAAAEWGWNAARMASFNTFPHPVVEWSPSGEPLIAYGDTDADKYKAVQARAMSGTATPTGHLETRRAATEETDPVRSSALALQHRAH